MSTDINLSASSAPSEFPVVPALQAGDRLTREEFERRYQAMPDVKKAELIEGVVYMASPVSTSRQGAPHFRLTTWLGVYEASTHGIQGADNATVRLDWKNEPQPDLYLRILPEHGGQTHDNGDCVSDGDCVSGSPELCCEVSASSASYDLHDKKAAYLRNGVLEYLVWRVDDRAIDWFALRGGEYVPLESDHGLFKSQVFSGLWLDAEALLQGDMRRVLEVVNQDLASPEHAEFSQRLKQQGRTE